MKSMTGFGRAKQECSTFDVSIDISSVNKKGFELSVSLPRDWAPMERLISQTLKNLISRGKVSVSIKVENKQTQNATLLNDSILSAYQALQNSCNQLNIEFNPTPELLLKLNDSIDNKPALCDWQDSWAEIEPVLANALSQLDDMRNLEGENLKQDLSDRLALMLNMVSNIENQSLNTVQNYKNSLMQRLEQFNLDFDINDERVLKEICLFADKCDICEEITRLKSHINQFNHTINQDDSIGRKLDFICQEIGREINTIASKANSLDLTKIAIDFKNELERIREQTQNIL